MNDARLSTKEITAAAGLVSSSCYEWLKALRSKEVFRDFHADIDMALIASIQEVRAVFLVCGHFDLILHLAVRDMEQLKLAISEHFNRHASVLSVETSIVFNRQTQ
jgi:DNA-binding Lrp family transcriptional regulator